MHDFYACVSFILFLSPLDMLGTNHISNLESVVSDHKHDSKLLQYLTLEKQCQTINKNIHRI